MTLCPVVGSFCCYQALILWYQLLRNPLVRLSLTQVLLAGPSWSGRWVLPGFGPLAITSLPALLESHPLARFSLLVGVLISPGFGVLVPPGFGPLMIRFVGVSPTDSTLPRSSNRLGVTRLCPSGDYPSSLESHPLARLSLAQALIAGLLRLGAGITRLLVFWQ